MINTKCLVFLLTLFPYVSIHFPTSKNPVILGEQIEPQNPQNSPATSFQVLFWRFACRQVDMPVPEKEIDMEKELQRLEKQLNQVPVP